MVSGAVGGGSSVHLPGQPRSAQGTLPASSLPASLFHEFFSCWKVCLSKISIVSVCAKIEQTFQTILLRVRSVSSFC